MDWDLWNAPYNPDVIEEDALREKSCIQVLKILITKADTEIDELEQDLIFLQSELAWIENEEWSEIGYNALTDKIDSLDVSMKSLRNENVDDVEVHLLMHSHPAEKLHEILQALLDNYFYKKDLQPKDSSFHTLKVDSGFAAGEIEINSCSAISIQKGKGTKSEFDTKVGAVVLNLSLSCADKEKHHAEKVEIQPRNVGVSNAISDSPERADDNSDTMKKSSSSASTITNGDLEEHSSIAAAGLISVKPMAMITDPSEKDVAAEELKCSNENKQLCISNVPDHEPQQGPIDSPVSETDKTTDVTSSEIMIPLNSPDNKETVKVEAALTEKENCALTSLLEQPDKNENTAIAIQPEEEDKSMPQVENSPAEDSKTKGNTDSSPLNFAPVDCSWSLVMKGKKRKKPGDGENGDEKPNSVCKKTKNSLAICDVEAVEPIPNHAEMEKMKLVELRKLAKGHKLKHSQLNKKEVIQMLLACRNGDK